MFYGKGYNGRLHFNHLRSHSKVDISKLDELDCTQNFCGLEVLRC